MACQIFRVLQPLYLHALSGYWGDHAYIGDGEFMHRLSGAPGDTVNPNGLGFIVASVIPFLHYLCWPQRSWLVKGAYVATAICLLYGLILTGSRSAVVAVLIDVLLIAWRSKSRFLGIAIVAIGLGVSVHYMNANFIDRYESIVSNDTQNARTREGRINGTLQDFELGLERPIVGFGLGTSEEANWHVLHSDLMAHDVYAEALIEVGIPGLLIYLSFLVSVARCVSQTRTALARAPPDSDGYEFKQAMSSALRVWVPMALVFFLSQYGLRELDWYIAAGMAGSLFGLVRQLPVSPAPSTNERSPLTAGSFGRDGAFLTQRASSKAR
jgi:O-antigen ligase